MLFLEILLDFEYEALVSRLHFFVAELVVSLEVSYLLLFLLFQDLRELQNVSGHLLLRLLLSLTHEVL